MENIDIRQMLAMVAHSDHVAFRSMFDRFYPQVYGFLKSFLHTDEDAADVSQEVFIKIWTMRAILPEINNIQGYIYRMTVNSAVNFAKQSRRYEDILQLDLPDDRMIEDMLDTRAKQKRILAAVSSMPGQRRRVFVMSRLELIPNDKIAEALGISKKTVENHLNLALRELRLSGLNY